MITWGISAGSRAFAGNLETVYALRFLLGIAEAGYFPGILLYLTHWYPNAYRPKAVATVMVAIPLADEERERAATTSHRAVFRDRKVLGLCAAYFLLLSGAYPLAYWMPSVIDNVGEDLSGVQVGWLSALPFLLAAICVFVTGRLVRDERSSVPVLVALGASVVTFVPSPPGRSTRRAGSSAPSSRPAPRRSSRPTRAWPAASPNGCASPTPPTPSGCAWLRTGTTTCTSI